MLNTQPLALLPIVLFLVLFLGSGIYYSLQGVDYAFYQVSSTVAILPAIVLSIIIAKGKLSQRVQDFIEGVSNHNVITMVLIYLLAGAYSSVASAIGGVDSTVQLCLAYIPESFLLPGLFIMSSLISTAMGTSMGTIAAVTPIAVAIANAAGLSLPISVGAIVSGAMFGDNLSIISNTTIASVRTQACDMKEKFFLNLKLALPAMILTVLLLYFFADQGHFTASGQYDLLKILPYLLVLVLAMTGMNVMIVLAIGIFTAGLMGLITTPDYTLLKFSKNIFQGYSSMQEIMILSMFIGGLGELVKRQGGLNYLVHLIERMTFKIAGNRRSQRIGEFGISILVSLADICTANNTVAILLSGDAAREIAKKENINPSRSAAFIDIFSCVFQGILPYSAQLLLAASIAGLSPFDLIANVHYCYFRNSYCFSAFLTFHCKRTRDGNLRAASGFSFNTRTNHYWQDYSCTYAGCHGILSYFGSCDIWLWPSF